MGVSDFIIDRKKIKKMKKWIRLLPVILWMILIFYFSSESGVQSSETSGFLVQISHHFFPGLSLSIMTCVIRKCAHMFLYLILSILVINAIKPRKQYILISFLFCLFYACTDEIHQLFVIGRSGSIQDVLVDMVGVLIGIVFMHLLQKRDRKID